ncbi:ABC transporter ATP-binding protein [Microvirga zambiensis]|uniref:ABC transporter ATP-binding protein n=1 Tax=Microvirga zambiensis TaxID=1402137 RepID=UPI001AEFAB77|nr:ABC transporter ATP-binding protein [Microvirga zambiensis]
MLDVQRLAIGYGSHVIGRDLSFSLMEGRALALLGPNGSGKTTLLKTVLGLLPAKAGAVLLNGRRIDALPVAERARRIAYVPQVHAGTFGFLTRDVVMMGRAAHGGILSAPSACDHAVVDRVIDRLGLTHLSERPYTLISGGERQLVLFARALAQEAPFIVLDAPTANLDFANQGVVLRETWRLREAGYGILFTTHDPNHALRWADDTLMLRQGALLHHGASDAVLTGGHLSELYGIPVEELRTAGRRAFLPSS